MAGRSGRRGGRRFALVLALVAAALTAPLAKAAEIQWRSATFNYQAQDKPLRDLIRDFAANQGLVAVIAPEVESVPVNAKFSLTPQSMLEMLATSFGLIWYYDGRALYVYPAGNMTSTVVGLRNPHNIKKLQETLTNLGIEEDRYPIAYDNKQNTAFITGPPRYVELVIAAMQAGDSQEAGPSAHADIRVFPLRYAWAADFTFMQGGVEQRLPGVVSLLRQLYLQPGAPLPGASVANPPKRPDIADRLRGYIPPRQMPIRSGDAARPVADIVPLIENVASPPPPPSTLAPQSAPTLPQFQADGRMNAVVIRDRPDRMAFYEGVIRALDIKPGLVEIEVRILELSSDAIDSLGIDWRLHSSRADLQFGRGNLPNLGFGTALAEGAPQVGPLPPGAGGNGSLGALPPPGIVPPVPSFNLPRGGVLTTVLGDAGRYLIARVNALAQEGKANILSSPRVLTLDNVEAVLENTSTFFVRVAGNLDVGLFNVSAGTSLRVTPLIVNEGNSREVKLAIRIEDGSLSNQFVDQIPVIRRSTITTQTFIKEGESLLIGGYKTEVQRDTDVGVPGLSTVPILGNLFKYREKQITRVERLFLLTPRLAAP